MQFPHSGIVVKVAVHPLPLTPLNLRLSTATHSSCPRSVVYSFFMHIQPLKVHFMTTSCFLQILFSYFLALRDKHSAFITWQALLNSNNVAILRNS